MASRQEKKKHYLYDPAQSGEKENYSLSTRKKNAKERMQLTRLKRAARPKESRSISAKMTDPMTTGSFEKRGYNARETNPFTEAGLSRRGIKADSQTIRDASNAYFNEKREEANGIANRVKTPFGGGSLKEENLSSSKQTHDGIRARTLRKQKEYEKSVRGATKKRLNQLVDIMADKSLSKEEKNRKVANLTGKPLPTKADQRNAAADPNKPVFGRSFNAPSFATRSPNSLGALSSMAELAPAVRRAKTLKDKKGELPQVRFGSDHVFVNSKTGEPYMKSKGDASARSVQRLVEDKYDRQTAYNGTGESGLHLIPGKKGSAIREGDTSFGWENIKGKRKGKLHLSTFKEAMSANASKSSSGEKKPRRSSAEKAFDDTQIIGTKGQGGHNSTWASRHQINAFARENRLAEGKRTPQGKQLIYELSTAATNGTKAGKRAVQQDGKIKLLPKTDDPNKLVQAALRLARRRGITFDPGKLSSLAGSAISPAQFQTALEKELAKQAAKEPKTAKGKEAKQQKEAEERAEKRRITSQRNAEVRARRKRNAETNGRDVSPQTTRVERERILSPHAVAQAEAEMSSYAKNYSKRLKDGQGSKTQKKKK